MALVDLGELALAAQHTVIVAYRLQFVVLHRAVLDQSAAEVGATEEATISARTCHLRFRDVKVTDFTDVVPSEKAPVVTRAYRQMGNGVVVAHKGALEHPVLVACGVRTHGSPVASVGVGGGQFSHIQVHNQFEEEVITTVLNLGEVTDMGGVVGSEFKMVGGVGHIVEAVLVDDRTESLHFR